MILQLSTRAPTLSPETSHPEKLSNYLPFLDHVTILFTLLY